MLWKSSVSCILALILTGCVTPKAEIRYVPTYIDKPIICNVPEPVAQSMLEIELKKVFSDDAEWWITASDADYKKLATNNARILKYLRDLKDYNIALKDCMKPKKES